MQYGCGDRCRGTAGIATSDIGAYLGLDIGKGRTSPGPGRRAPGAVVGAAGTVAHSRLAEFAVSPGPPLYRGWRDLEPLGRPAQGLIRHRPRSGPCRRRPVSVRGALRWGMRAFRAGVDVAIHTEPGRPSLVQDPQTVITAAAPNLRGRNTCCDREGSPGPGGQGELRVGMVWSAVEGACRAPALRRLLSEQARVGHIDQV